MRWLTVRSSQIANVAYDDGNLNLYVQFHGDADKVGKVYRYMGVPSEVFLGFIQSESHGKYLSANIKGHFPYSWIENPEQLDIHV